MSGTLDDPYEESQIGPIVNVHWKHGFCGGTATADSVDAWPLLNTHGYVGTGDLDSINPAPMFAGGCREGQKWQISVQIQLDMVLGPLGPDGFHPTQPDLVHFTQDAHYSADFAIYTYVSGALGAPIAAMTLTGALHNESITVPGIPGIPGVTETATATNTVSASGIGAVAFAFVATIHFSPGSGDPNGLNVGGGAGFGAVSIRDLR